MKGTYGVTLIDLRSCLSVTVKADDLNEADKEAEKEAKRLSNDEHHYKAWIVLPKGEEI